MSIDPDSTQEPSPFTELVHRARSGLRRDVEALLAGVDDATLLIPLAEDVPEAPEGERMELDHQLALIPHLLPDDDGQLFSALFTQPGAIGPIVDALGWQTSGEPLKVCEFPARIALEMALEVIDGKDVIGLVLDAGADSELCLTRSELASILAGRAVPLLAYVANIPEEEQANTLVAEPGDPPPPELISALESWLSETPSVVTQKLERTFNPDRDLEPHLTLTLSVENGVDRAQLFREVTARIEGKLPPPGYLDVLFVDAKS
ncbi:MAG: SseB family protein [Myxococcota bacterium]